MLIRMSSGLAKDTRKPNVHATESNVRASPNAPQYAVEDLNAFGDVLRECREQVGQRHLASVARMAFAKRRDLRVGLKLVKKLPVVDIVLPDDSHGRLIRKRLGGTLPGMKLRMARAALELPDDRATYLRGRPKQALRTNLRHAETQGIVCKTLPRIEDQEAAIKSFYAASHFTERDRVYLGEALQVNPGQQDFYSAEEADGRILAIAAVVVTGRTALLLFHHSLESEHAAIARYALTMHIVSALIERRVNIMLVGSALTLPPGLRYFQQRLGFRAFNVRLSKAAVLEHRADAAAVAPS
jgi:hypothetical protein